MLQGAVLVPDWDKVKVNVKTWSVLRTDVPQLSGDCVYLASFLAVREVAVSGKASGSKGLPWVRMLWSLKGEGGAMMSGLVNLTVEEKSGPSPTGEQAVVSLSSSSFVTQLTLLTFAQIRRTLVSFEA